MAVTNMDGTEPNRSTDPGYLLGLECIANYLKVIITPSLGLIIESFEMKETCLKIGIF